MFELEEVVNPGARIKVIGIGGGGGNAINSMIASGITGVEFIAINTDMQALSTNLAPVKLQIGARLTKGLGAGSNPELGRDAAMEDASRIEEVLKGSDMVFITAGMGGGTGTGGAPVVAAIARDLGILTVGVVTKPFYYEGKRRIENALRGIEELKKQVDSLIVIPNDRIRLVAEKGMSLTKSFELVNDVLRHAVQGITDLILRPGLINLDFADLKTVLLGAGRAVMGMGTSSGRGSGVEAAKRAATNPLLEDTSILGARRVLLNITGGTELDMDSVNEICSFVYDSVHEEVHLIFGAIIDESLGENIKVTVVAADFEEVRNESKSGPTFTLATNVEEVSQKQDLTEPSLPIHNIASNKTPDILSSPLPSPSIPPHPHRITVRGAERILSKDLEEFELPRELLQYDHPLDIPAFMRRQEISIMNEVPQKKESGDEA